MKIGVISVNSWFSIYIKIYIKVNADVNVCVLYNCVCMFACLYMHSCTSYLCSQPCSLRVPGSNDIPKAIHSPSVQILLSKYHSPLKGQGRESTRWAWKIFLCQKIRKCPKNDTTCQTDTEGAPTGQIWGNYDPLNEREIRESIH